MTITDIYYSDHEAHKGVWIEFKEHGETGYRPIDLPTAVVLHRKLSQAITDTKKASL